MSPLDNCPHDLVYVSNEMEGFTRRKNGKGFIYFEANGKKVVDQKILQRINKLVIPPAWEKVWICKEAKGHLQVTGYDQKRRKQYIYHPDWTDFRQQSKFQRLYEFGCQLPVIRKKLEQHIRLKGWPKEKILALAVMMLDEYFIRIGNKQYEKENKTYGLTTLRRKHLIEKDSGLFLRFKAKSGKERKVKIASKKLIRLIKETSELPGYEIFRYLDDHKKSQPVHSQDVNEYLYELSGSKFTAKDFRTWGGTVTAIDNFAEAKAEVAESKRKKLEPTLVKKVAEVLGNTIAVCREYYIHPRVLQVLLDDELATFRVKKLNGIRYKKQLSEHEHLVLKIIAPK